MLSQKNQAVDTLEVIADICIEALRAELMVSPVYHLIP